MNRRHFEPTDKATRRELYANASLECERKGYPGFAEVNREMAALLTPRAPREEGDDEKTNQRAPKRKQWERDLPDPGSVG